MNEVGKRADTGDVVVKIDPQYFRPTEVETLLGDPSKAKKILNWEPKVTLEKLVSEMIENDKNDSMRELLVDNKFPKSQKEKKF